MYGTGIPGEFEVGRFPVRGIAICSESKWVRPDESISTFATSKTSLTDAELAGQGYQFESHHAAVVPLILMSPPGTEPMDVEIFDDFPETEPNELALLDETVIRQAPHVVVWCDWPDESDDERRLKLASKRLQAKGLRTGPISPA